MNADTVGFDPVCPTIHELSGKDRFALPLLPWAAHHRALRAFTLPQPYSEVLHEEEQAWLLHQAGFTAAGNPYLEAAR